jgi:hypothetical protein
MLAKQQEAGESGPPGDPIHDIRMFDFGNDAAIMLSHHTPHLGGKPYYNVRLWVLRDGRWQLVASQQTTIRVGRSRTGRQLTPGVRKGKSFRRPPEFNETLLEHKSSNAGVRLLDRFTHSSP